MLTVHKRAQQNSAPILDMGRLVTAGHRRPGPPLEAEALSEINGSMELAGQRVAYFTRLLDEHSLADLPRPSARVEA